MELARQVDDNTKHWSCKELPRKEADIDNDISTEKIQDLTDTNDNKMILELQRAAR